MKQVRVKEIIERVYLRTKVGEQFDLRRKATWKEEAKVQVQVKENPEEAKYNTYSKDKADK